jgi:hypothetical protein
MGRYLKLSGVVCVCLALNSGSTVSAGWFSDSVGKTIEKSAQDVGKSIDKIQSDRDAGRPVPVPQIEQSPANPCRINPALPQCKDLGTDDRIK